MPASSKNSRNSALQPIFQDFKLKGENLVPDVRGKERRAFMLSRGGILIKHSSSTAQRLQKDGIILKRDTMRRLHNLGWPLKSMRRGGSSGMSDHDSLIVDVVQDESHRRPQPPHIDYPLSSKRELLNVAILAVTEFSLYVYPRSHTLVREAIRFLGDESNFHHSSNSSSDSMFSRHLGLQVPIKVCLKAGELLIFDGYLVHAGTEGEVGVVRPRLHLYLQECHPNVVASDAHGHTSTYPLNLLHPNVESSMFASKFARIVMT
ncbi:hypothetical protein CEUSTIGMA_g13666.t1 [Chlamydomonas eustigma]|uniref:Phytanoyl-CoA dioxygenase n=1 Tax=Chlamydomonas eustigma TaxID=1157962 RepID=A0A250XT58_9CHLO|nr:hypothetical protein CEUSTIGMA_g13666.t1 [Chlamydomonas eustigma]|eukprot:GAX86254.1 hypothetical protein CEUSTIGMA_g13666.t1 [Chlamydomonas eustigma]